MRALLALTLVLTACGGNKADAPAGKDTTQSSTETAQPQADPPATPAVDAHPDVAVSAPPEGKEPWRTTGGDFGTDLEGTIVFKFNCPSGGSSFLHGDGSTIWGGTNGIYTDDSPICVAAVHAGRITAKDGGVVVVQLQPHVDDFYDGFEANGVTSDSYTASDRAISFL